MKPDRAFSDLIGRIYDCALDTTLWSNVLGEITGALGGRLADMVVSHPLEGTQILAAFHNWPEDLAAAAEANAHLNPGLPLGLTMPLCQPFCTTRDFDVNAIHSSRHWKTLFAGRGFYDYVFVAVTRTVTSVGTWGVLADEVKGPYTDDDIELARLLSPHIKRSVEISGVLGRQRVEAGTLRAALDALSAAALIIEPNGKILFRNAAANEELAKAHVIREQGSKVLGVTPEAVKLLGVLADAETRERQRGLDAHLTNQAGRTLHATWAALEQAGHELGSPILLLLREPDAAFTTPISTATALFSLTMSETQVLAQVLHGSTLAEIADVLGVARSTVKSHLDAIYRKTQTNRQSELVRLTLSLASPLRR